MLHMSKKNFAIIFFVCISIIGFFVARLILGGKSGEWVCEGGRWTPHGEPRDPMPQEGCGPRVIPENEFGNGERCEVYRTDDFKIKYPHWPNIDASRVLEPERTKIAVSNDGCNVVITADRLSDGETLEAYVEQKIAERQASSIAPIEILDRELRDTSARVDAFVTMGDTVLRSISYEYLSGAGNVYGVGFVAERDAYKDVCRPYVEEMLDSMTISE